MNRFMINLRQIDTAQLAGSGTASQGRSNVSAMEFRASNSVIGNIGEPLAFAQDEDVDLIVEEPVTAVDGEATTDA